MTGHTYSALASRALAVANATATITDQTTAVERLVLSDNLFYLLRAVMSHDLVKHNFVGSSSCTVLNTTRGRGQGLLRSE